MRQRLSPGWGVPQQSQGHRAETLGTETPDPYPWRPLSKRVFELVKGVNETSSICGVSLHVLTAFFTNICFSTLLPGCKAQWGFACYALGFREDTWLTLVCVK